MWSHTQSLALYRPLRVSPAGVFPLAEAGQRKDVLLGRIFRGKENSVLLPVVRLVLGLWPSGLAASGGWGPGTTAWAPGCC